MRRKLAGVKNRDVSIVSIAWILDRLILRMLNNLCGIESVIPNSLTKAKYRDCMFPNRNSLDIVQQQLSHHANCQ